jgi:hypothetical protein
MSTSSGFAREIGWKMPIRAYSQDVKRRYASVLSLSRRVFGSADRG